MIGLNPWNLKRNRFSILILESDDCRLEDVLLGNYRAKDGSIKHISIVKVCCDNGTSEIVGMWDRQCNGDALYFLKVSQFLEDSYLVCHQGNRYVFPMLNGNLVKRGIKELEKDDLMDIGEVFDWVEDKDLVNRVICELKDIYDSIDLNLKEKAMGMSQWFVQHMFPILKNGFK